MLVGGAAEFVTSLTQDARVRPSLCGRSQEAGGEVGAGGGSCLVDVGFVACLGFRNKTFLIVSRVSGSPAPWC